MGRMGDSQDEGETKIRHAMACHYIRWKTGV